MESCVLEIEIEGLEKNMDISLFNSYLERAFSKLYTEDIGQYLYYMKIYANSLKNKTPSRLTETWTENSQKN